MGLFDKLLKGAVDAIDNAAAKNGNGHWDIEKELCVASESELKKEQD